MSLWRTAPSVAGIVGSCVSLQVGAVIAAPLLAQYGAWLTTTVRLLLAGSLLLLLHRPRALAWPRETWRITLLFGGALAGMNGFFYASIARIPLGIAVTIEFAGPLVLAALLSRQRRDLYAVLAAAVAITVLGVGDGWGTDRLDPVGVVYALIAAAFWSAYISVGARITAACPGQGPLSVAMVIGAGVLTPVALSTVPALTINVHDLLPFVGVAVLSSFVPYSLEFAAMRRLRPHVFGVLLCLEPIVASIAGKVFLGQALSAVHVAAMVVVVAAAVAVTLNSVQSDLGLDGVADEPVPLAPQTAVPTAQP